MNAYGGVYICICVCMDLDMWKHINGHMHIYVDTYAHTSICKIYNNKYITGKNI